MFGSLKKKKKVLGENPNEPETIKMIFEVHMTQKKSYDTADILLVKQEVTMLCNTDSKEEDIKAEVETIFNDIYKRVGLGIEASPLLTDGYHAEKAEEKL